MKILIAGDYYPQSDFDTSYIRSLTREVDYSILNYESPVAENSDKPIFKCGPNLKTTEKDVARAKDMGFDAVTLANNHTLDYGEDALLRTIKTCAKYDLDTIGAGENLDDAGKILYKEIERKKLAIINCCEHEFSIATEETAGTNPLNPIRQYNQIYEAKQNADYVLVIVHGGHEHFQLPSPRMVETYRFFIDAGADAVVNHQQHCYSGYERYNGNPIFYGLGNFVFPRKNSSKNWNEGFLLTLEFEGDKIDYKVTSYIQNDETGIRKIDKEESKEFNNKIAELNSIIIDDKKLNSEHKKWMNQKENVLKNVLAPYSNRYLRALCNRGLLPSLIKAKRLVVFLNYIGCESHRDRVIDFIQRRIKRN